MAVKPLHYFYLWGHPHSMYAQKLAKLEPPPPPLLYAIVCIWLDPSPHPLCVCPMWMTPANGEAFWLLFASLISLLSGSTVQPENTYSCIFKVTGQV